MAKDNLDFVDTELCFSKWRRAQALRLPQLASRVFALRGKPYPGYGFHWALEKNLGHAIAELNDYGTRRPADSFYGDHGIVNRIVLTTLIEELERQIVKAENGV